MKVPSLPVLKPPTLSNLIGAKKEDVLIVPPAVAKSHKVTVYEQLVSIQRTMGGLHSPDQHVSSLEHLQQEQCERNMYVFRTIQCDAVTKRCKAGQRVVSSLCDVVEKGHVSLERRCRAICVALQAFSKLPDGQYRHRLFISVTQQFSMSFYKFLIALVSMAVHCVTVTVNNEDVVYYGVDNVECKYAEQTEVGRISSSMISEMVNAFVNMNVSVDLPSLRRLCWMLELLTSTWKEVQHHVIQKQDYTLYLSVPFPVLAVHAVNALLHAKIDMISTILALVSVRNAAHISQKQTYQSVSACNQLDNIPRCTDYFLDSYPLPTQMHAQYIQNEQQVCLQVIGQPIDFPQQSMTHNLKTGFLPAQLFTHLIPTEARLTTLHEERLCAYIANIFADTYILESPCTLLVQPIKILQHQQDPPLRYMHIYDAAVVKPLRVVIAKLYTHVQYVPLLLAPMTQILAFQPIETVIQRVHSAVSYIQCISSDKAYFGNQALTATGGVWSWVPVDSEFHEEFLVLSSVFDRQVLQFCRGPTFQFVLLHGAMQLWLCELLRDFTNTTHVNSSQQAFLQILAGQKLDTFAYQFPPLDECTSISSVLVLLLLIKHIVHQCTVQIEHSKEDVNGAEMLVSVWSSTYLLQITAYMEDHISSCLESFTHVQERVSSKQNENLPLYQQLKLIKNTNFLDLTVVCMQNMQNQVYPTEVPVYVMEQLSKLPKTPISQTTDVLVQLLHSMPFSCSLPTMTLSTYKYLSGRIGNAVLKLTENIVVYKDGGQWTLEDVIQNTHLNYLSLCSERDIKHSFHTNDVPLFKLAVSTIKSANATNTSISGFASASVASLLSSNNNKTLSSHILTGHLGEAFKVQHELTKCLLQFADALGSTRVVVPAMRMFLSVWAQVTMSVTEGCWDLQDSTQPYVAIKLHHDFSEYHQKAMQWALGPIRASGGVGHEARCETQYQIEEQQQQVLIKGIGKIHKAASQREGELFPTDHSEQSMLWQSDMQISTIDKIQETVLHSSSLNDEEWNVPDWVIAITWLRSRATATLLDPTLKFSKVREARVHGSLQWLSYRELCCGLLSLYTESNELQQCLLFVQQQQQ